MIVEIGYTYQSDKQSPAQQSWTYFYVKGEDEDKAITKAKAHFKKWCAELGWTRQTKLTHVECMRKSDALPEYIVVSKQELPPKRKNVKRNTKTNITSVRQSKKSAAGEKPKVRRRSTKPTASDEPSKLNRTAASTNRRQTKQNKAGSRTPSK